MCQQRWFSGRMLACHAGGPGSIPGRCSKSFCNNLNRISRVPTTLVTGILEHGKYLVFKNNARKCAEIALTSSKRNCTKKPKLFFTFFSFSKFNSVELPIIY
jgi:hypothetical protein